MSRARCGAVMLAAVDMHFCQSCGLVAMNAQFWGDEVCHSGGVSNVSGVDGAAMRRGVDPSCSTIAVELTWTREGHGDA